LVLVICDDSLQLACIKGTCQPKPPQVVGEGEACSDTAICDDAQQLTCVDGACQKAPPKAGPGEACSDQILCDTAQLLSCVDGACVVQPAGPGEPCSETRACKADSGLACAQGYCRATCSSVADGCASGFECLALPAGDPSGAPGVCLPGGKLSGPGQYGTFCPDAMICDKAAGFFCKGVPGDASAFCTQKDGCATDTDCPAAFWCGSVTNPIDDKGNIDFDHPIKACLTREFCSPCATDLDCSAKTGGICVPDVNGEKFCSLPCNPGKNSCQIGVSCVDLGDGRSACRPDVGVCHVADAPKGCDPCRIDTDCGPGGLCNNGAVGNKPGMRWCSTPCGGPDASGKNTCPIAPNGAEMVCLDENELSLGGPFDSTQPNSIYKRCYKPLTVDNTDAFKGKDPTNNACGNSKREGDEECDDGNKTTTDGCDNCKIIPTCRFTLAEPNDDGKTTLMQDGMPFDKVPTFCKSVLVEGSIEAAGDIDSLLFSLPDGASAWAELFTDKPGACSGDLLLEIRGGNVDLNVKCKDLSASVKNLDGETPSLCPDNATLGCGSCDTPGICGSCDDDSGIGDCPKMLISSTLQFQGYKVKFDSAVKTARIYARDPSATVANYILVVDRLTPGDQGPASPPGLGCY
jgi:cysteine-rich repeat protein